MTNHNDNAAGFETHPDRGPWTQVPYGRFYPLDPRPEDIDPRDIFHALAQVNRFGGHADDPVSVAQHSVQCAAMASEDGASLGAVYAILMHDAAEAYIGDMQRPLKSVLPEFKKIEAKISAVIKVALQIPHVDEGLIKYYDNKAWMWEKRDLFTTAEETWPHTPDITLPDEVMQAWDWKTSRGVMRECYDQLRRLLG